MITAQGENLTFMISQPRSGSTMLQRILHGHPLIHTVSEPWLMLHPLYALRPDGNIAEYNEKWAKHAVQDFLMSLPRGMEDYIEGLRRMYSYIYDKALEDSGKYCFLDKTPRYYFIINELFETFPKAHYIILLRNPLAVLCSIIKSWIGERWFSLWQLAPDLIRAPELLLQGIEVLGRMAIVVRYEDLVSQPESEVRRICDALKIPFTAHLINYGQHNVERWRHGDGETVYQHKRPMTTTRDEWEKQIEDPQVWRLAYDYLKLLGEGTVNRMGYSYRELQETMMEKQRPRKSLRFTFPLAKLLRKPARERSRRAGLDRCIVRLGRSLQRGDIPGAIVSALSLIYCTLFDFQ